MSKRAVRRALVGLLELRYRQLKQMIYNDMPGNVLYEDPIVTITKEDVERALEEGRRRMGNEYYQRLTNEPWESENDGVI